MFVVGGTWPVSSGTWRAATLRYLVAGERIPSKVEARRRSSVTVHYALRSPMRCSSCLRYLRLTRNVIPLVNSSWASP